MDESGATEVVELKRGMTPREVVAQTIEYAAWVDSLSLEELNGIARAYALRRGKTIEGLWDLYRDAFFSTGEHNEEDASGDEAKITFNARQRMFIVAEEFSPQVEQTLRYLRTRLGVDISGVRFSVHKADGEILIDTEIVVGREALSAAASKSAASAVPESHEQTKERVTSEFVRDQVDALEEWLESFGVPELTVKHLNRSDHAIYVGTKRVVWYYFALKWVHFWIADRTPSDMEALKHLSQASSVNENGDGVAFNVGSERDLELARPLLQNRLKAPPTELPNLQAP